MIAGPNIHEHQDNEMQHALQMSLVGMSRLNVLSKPSLKERLVKHACQPYKSSRSYVMT